MGVGIWGFWGGGGEAQDAPVTTLLPHGQAATALPFCLGWSPARQRNTHTMGGWRHKTTHISSTLLCCQKAPCWPRKASGVGERGLEPRSLSLASENGVTEERTNRPLRGVGGGKAGGNRVSHVGQRRASPTTSAGVISGGAVMVGWSKMGGGIWTGSSWKGKSRWRMVFCWEGIKCRATEPPPPLPPNLGISSVSSRANFLNCCFCFIPILMGWGLMCIINNCSAFCPLSRAPVQSLSGMDAKCQCNAPPCPSL